MCVEHVAASPTRQQARNGRIGRVRPGHRVEMSEQRGVRVVDTPDARRVICHAEHATSVRCGRGRPRGNLAPCNCPARNDRTRAHGRQHGPPADERRARVRRVRRVRRRGRVARRRGDDRRRVDEGARRRPRRAASHLADGAGGLRRLDDRRPGAAARSGRHDHRRRQLLVPRRRRPLRTARRAVRHRLPRRRHERRRPRTRTRLLPDGRRRRRTRHPPGTDLRHAGARIRVGRAHPEPCRVRRPGERRARLAALRSERGRTLREDGPQRHRVRDDAGLRRGPQRAGQGQHRRRGARQGRRDRAADPSRVLPLRHRPGGGHRGVAPRQRRRQLAARPHRRRAGEGPEARRVRGPGVATPARAAGRSPRRSTRACRCPCCRRRCTSGSRPAAGPTWPNKVLSAMRAGFGGHAEQKREHADERRRPAPSLPTSATHATRPTPRLGGRLPQADALVLFGATGDLAKRKLFPALYHMESRGELDVPVIGVARSDWTDDDFREHAADAIRKAVDTVDEEVLQRLHEPARPGPGRLRRPRHVEPRSRTCSTSTSSEVAVYYMAIPPTMFPTVAESLASIGLNERGRIVVEKPFGRDLASAHELNEVLHEVFPEQHIFRIDHYLGKESVEDLLVFRFSNTLHRADLEPPLRAQRADHDVGDDRRRRPRLVLRQCRRDPRRVPEPPPAGRRAAGDGAAGRPRVELPAGREGQGLRGDASSSTARRWCRGQYEGYRNEEGVAPDSDVETYVAAHLEIDSWRWAGVPWYVRCGKGLAESATEAVVELQAPPRLLFDEAGGPTPERNLIRLRLGKRDGVTFSLQAKTPGTRPRQPVGRGLGRLRRRPGRPPRGLRAPARRRDQGLAAALRPRGHRRAAVAHRRPGARRPGTRAPVPHGLVGPAIREPNPASTATAGSRRPADPGASAHASAWSAIGADARQRRGSDGFEGSCAARIRHDHDDDPVNPSSSATLSPPRPQATREVGRRGAVPTLLGMSEGRITEALADDPRPDDLQRAPSVVVVNTGDGKGKSSAAFGVMIRSVARGWPVAVVQFVKSGKWNVGEEKIGRQLGVDWHNVGDGFTWESDNLEHDKALAREGWAKAAEHHRRRRAPPRRPRRDHLPVHVGLDRHRRGRRGDPRPPDQRQHRAHRARRAPGAHRRRRHGDRDAQGQARLRRRHQRDARHRVLMFRRSLVRSAALRSLRSGEFRGAASPHSACSGGASKLA